jgi:hypothetical protein
VNFYGIGNYEDVDGDLNSMKLKIPNFQGKNDPEAYKVSTSGSGQEDETNQQRENIFHTRCYVQSKVCSLIIHSESCVLIFVVPPLLVN